MQEIADEAGVGMTTIYRAFGNRLQLHTEALAMQMCDELHPTVLALAAASDPVAGLRDLSLAQVDVAIRRRDKLAETPGWIEAFITEFLGRYSDIIAAAMARAQAAGDLNDELVADDIAGVTRLFLGGLAQPNQSRTQAHRYIRIWFKAVAPGWSATQEQSARESSTPGRATSDESDPQRKDAQPHAEQHDESPGQPR